MDVSIDARWEGFVRSAVDSGRFASAGDVVREGLRLVEERETKLRALRETVETSIAGGAGHDDNDIAAAVQARLNAWEAGRKAG
jgi:antitoxin ParD1/3/4